MPTSAICATIYLEQLVLRDIKNLGSNRHLLTLWSWKYGNQIDGWNVLASSAICSWVDSKHVAQEADVDCVEGNAAMRETVAEVHRVQSCVTPPR